MYKHIAYGGVVVAAAVALSGPGAGGAGASATASRAGPAGQAAVTAGPAAAGPGTQLWVKRYNGPGSYATSVAVGPGGGTVYVTGTSYGSASGGDYVTVAYNAATGAQRWVKRYNGPASQNDWAQSMALSPGGGTVFVTGYSVASIRLGGDYATVAYNAATGAQRWVKRYNGPAKFSDNARSVAVSPTGATVYVTGGSCNDRNESSADYVTVAYNAATGAQRWVKRYNGPANGGIDGASSVAVSPRGSTVYVTGTSESASGTDYATVAYNAATGAQQWVRRYADGDARSMAVSPGGETVYVTGNSYGSAPGGGYATVAYNAATGAQRWVKRYNGGDEARSVAVSPGGETVFVTGTSGSDYATVAYNAATGAQLWVKRYNGPGNLDDQPSSVAVSPDGAKVFVTGGSEKSGGYFDQYVTIAYSG